MSGNQMRIGKHVEEKIGFEDKREKNKKRPYNSQSELLNWARKVSQELINSLKNFVRVEE